MPGRGPLGPDEQLSPSTHGAYGPYGLGVSTDPLSPARLSADAEARIHKEIARASPELMEQMARGWARLEPYAELFARMDEEHGFPPGFTRAVSTKETLGRADILSGEVRSSAGAAGIMQLMPATARELGLRVDDEIDERLDPAKAIPAGATYLARMGAAKPGESALPIALAKYNYGPGNYWKWAQRKKGMPRETREYMGAVMDARKAFHQPAAAVAAEADSGEPAADRPRTGPPR